MSSTKDIYVVVRTYEAHLGANDNGKYGMSKRAKNPFSMGHDPEMDISPVLSPDTALYFLSIIGILRRIVELGRINTITKLSLLSFHLT